MNYNNRSMLSGNHEPLLLIGTLVLRGGVEGMARAGGEGTVCQAAQTWTSSREQGEKPSKGFR